MSEQQKPFWQKPAVLIGTGAVVLVAIVVAVMIGWINGVKNDGFNRQRDVVTKYQALETTLSTCLDNSMTAAGIAQQERNSLRDILVGTASARYQNPDGSVTTGIPDNSGIAFSAIKEAYPTVSDSLFAQLMTTAVGCRNQVSGVQQDLQALGGRFDTWTQTGSVFEKPFRSDFPDDRLVVIGPDGEKLYGRDALNFIVTPISVQAAKDAMTSKVAPSQDLFGTAQPTR